jgi:hypothetical protein
VNGVFARSDEGQALVIVGLAMVLLMGALVLAADWGFGLATRRAAQNQADSAALAAGRLLATTYVAPAQFSATQEQVWNAACVADNANAGGAGQAWDLRVSFFDGTAWTALSHATTDCSTSGSTAVPPGTLAVRAETSTTYLSLFGIGTRQAITVAASARARLTAGAAVRQLRLPTVPVGGPTVGPPGVGLSGSSTEPNAAIWPIVLNYRNWANAAASGPIIKLLWSDSSTDGNVLVTLSHFSPHEASAGSAQVHQLVTESDYTGSPSGYYGHPPTSRLVNVQGACGSLWDTNGEADLASAGNCDIPNWFNYGFRGSLSVGTNWTPSDSPTGWGDPRTETGFEGTPQPLESPNAFPAPRSSCSALTSSPFLTVPSCLPDGPASSNIGDWVETVPRAGVNDEDIRDAVVSFIERYGRDVPGGGDKSVVVNVFLWDCAEQFDSTQPAGSRWRLIPSTGDCSAISTSTSVDRVHLFAVVPMTIFESEVRLTSTDSGSVQLQAHWGDVFGDAGGCASLPPPAGCDLNPLMNSAFLVPDE